MAELKKRKFDGDAIQKGAWVGKEFGTPIPGWDDLCLKVRSYASSEYRDESARLAVDLKEADYVEGGRIKDAVAQRLTATAQSKVIILDWKNLTDGGKEVKFSQETALALLLDPDNKEFRDAVDFAAINVGNRRKVYEEAVEKN